MLKNVLVDIVGNFTLVFIGETGREAYWTWSLIGEDPITGQPFIISGLRHGTFADAAIQAWRDITNADWFDIRPAVEGLPPITNVWRRAFGSGFSHVTKFVETGEGQVSGVAVLTYLSRSEREKMRR